MSTYESSDKIRTVQNRQLGASIFEKTLFISTMNQIGASQYWFGFVEWDLADLNLNTLVPQFDIMMYSSIKVDGAEPGTFIYYNYHQKVPFTNPVVSGTDSVVGLISDSAKAYITYESSGGVKQGVTTGTSKLVIEYVIRGGSETTSRRFDVKIKGSDAITA